MIESEAALPLIARTVRVARTARGIELYFPPLRMPEVALPLAAFGVLASAVPALAMAVLLPSALADARGLLSAVLIAAFIVPFAIFGVIFVLLAIYMVFNSLLVRVDSEAIETWRLMLGLTMRRSRLERGELAAIEAEIAARYQSVFSAEPVYRLVARDGSRRRRVVVAETLKGEVLMERVKALIEAEARGAAA